MSTITSSAGASNESAYAQFAFADSNDKKTDSMGQADFLRLMTEQLKHQDPMDPLKGAEFLGQLAQFSTVQGIENMQQAMNAMASVMENDQSLRAATLVGHDALVEADSANLQAGAGVSGEIATSASGPVQLQILNASGQVVRQIGLDADGSGSAAFAWDGKDDAGNPVPAGNYSFKASSGTGKDAESLSVNLAAHIDSVSMGPQGLVLNLAGLGSLPLSSIRRIS